MINSSFQGWILSQIFFFKFSSVNYCHENTACDEEKALSLDIFKVCNIDCCIRWFLITHFLFFTVKGLWEYSSREIRDLSGTQGAFLSLLWPKWLEISPRGETVKFLPKVAWTYTTNLYEIHFIFYKLTVSIAAFYLLANERGRKNCFRKEALIRLVAGSLEQR